MKLTAKLVLVFLAAILVVQSLNAYLLTLREGEQFEEEMREQARYLTELMKSQLGDSQERRSERAGLLAKQMDRDHHGMSVRFVFLQNWPNKQLQPYAPTDRLRITYGEIYSVPRSNEKGERLLHVYSPVGEMEGKPAGLEVTGSFANADHHKRIILWQHLGVAAATLMCGVGVALLGVRLVGNRLQQLIQKTKRIAAGDFSDPVRVKGNDELSELATSLNEMCNALAESQKKIRAESTARVAAVEQLRHADRLNTVGRLASGVAHELGTPLSVVAGRAGLIASGELNEAENRKSAQIIKDEADRITGIIRQLLDFARRGAPQRAVADLRDITGQTVELLSPMAEKRQVKISVDLGESPLRARVDVGQIQQVLTNLTINALQAMPEGGEVRVTLGTADAVSPDDASTESQPCFMLSVQDRGQGIADEHLPHLFEPFFTTKDVGEGTGLGLSVSYGIAQDHGGWIDVTSVPGQGSRFTLYLPQEANQCSDES